MNDNKAKNKNSKKKQKKLPAGMLEMMIIGAVCGVIMNQVSFVAMGESVGFGIFIFEMVVLFLGYFIHLVVHEAGHLVAGLMTGYGFGSFRIGSLMLIKENGALKLKKHSLAGTGGQCLMTPPPKNDGDYPVIFYNLGGALMNVLVSVVFVVISVLLVEDPILFLIFSMFSLAGLLVAATNGIPIKLGMINNDGSNARELYKNKEAKICFHNQFTIIENVTAGMRLRDMDDDLFSMPSDEGMKNSISATGAVLVENRLMDRGDLDGALELIGRLLTGDNAIIGLHKNLLVCDKITILLLKQEKLDVVDQYYDLKEFQLFKKQMMNNISVLRTEYAYSLLRKGDEKRAREVLSLYEKASKTHPYRTDVESENEMIHRIDECYKDHKEKD